VIVLEGMWHYPQRACPELVLPTVIEWLGAAQYRQEDDLTARATARVGQIAATQPFFFRNCPCSQVCPVSSGKKKIVYFIFLYVVI